MSEQDKLNETAAAAIAAGKKATPRVDDDQGWGGVDPLGIASTTWAFTGGRPQRSRDDAIAKNTVGEFATASAHQHNEREEGTANYVANVVGSAAIPALVLGAATNGYTVTSVRIGTNVGHATLSVTFHKHIAATNTQSRGHKVNVYAPAFPTINGWGAQCMCGSNIDEACVESSSWSATIDHQDKPDNVGNHLVGRSQGVTIEAETAATVQMSLDDIEAGTGWEYTVKGGDTPNEGFHGATISAKKYAVAAAA